MSRDQHIDQSVTSIQSLLNTNGASFLMTSHVRSALWILFRAARENFINFAKVSKFLGQFLFYSYSWAKNNFFVHYCTVLTKNLMNIKMRKMSILALNYTFWTKIGYPSCFGCEFNNHKHLKELSVISIL